MNTFDPFSNRLSRDIRNELSESVVASILAGELTPSIDVKEKYSAMNLEPEFRHYIDDRFSRYQSVMTQIRNAGISADDFYTIAALLWNQELFFEVHEWLETKWHAARGSEKSVIQTLIQAAGTYVHLSLGRMNAARKIGTKALAGLKANREALPAIFNANLLIQKIAVLDAVPPKLDSVPSP